MNEKLSLTEVENLLYEINSQLISLKCIGLKQQLTEKELFFINESLGNCIKSIRNIKEEGFWKEGDKTFMIEERDYPHDENCGGGMCFCVNRAKRENPEKWKEFRERFKK